MLSAPAAAVELGNAAVGHDYARDVCAECHAVEKGETISPILEAPPFQEVADTQGMSARALVVWLQSPHPTMPDLILPAQDADNVIAYILSLRSPR
jgi:hypothetical protein